VCGEQEYYEELVRAYRDWARVRAVVWWWWWWLLLLLCVCACACGGEWRGVPAAGGGDDGVAPFFCFRPPP
jgi:hypothetical protein